MSFIIDWITYTMEYLGVYIVELFCLFNFRLLIHVPDCKYLIARVVYSKASVVLTAERMVTS